jgi:hypothetical protein
VTLNRSSKRILLPSEFLHEKGDEDATSRAQWSGSTHRRLHLNEQRVGPDRRHVDSSQQRYRVPGEADGESIGGSFPGGSNCADVREKRMNVAMRIAKDLCSTSVNQT